MTWLSRSFVLLALLGCERTSPAVCEPGRQIACACLAGTSGVQACKDSGRGYEPCQCPSAPPPVAAKKAVVPQTPELVPCPADFVALADRLTPRGDGDRESPADDERQAEKCTPGLFPRPGWAIVFRRGLGYHRMVVDATTKNVIARAKLERYGGSHDISLKRLATIDFDGDGTSEILEDLEGDGHGYQYENLSVFQVNGATLATALNIPLLSDNEAAQEDPTKAERYTASYEVTKEPDGLRGLVVTGKMVKGHPPTNRSGPPLSIGKKRYTWHDGHLAKD